MIARRCIGDRSPGHKIGAGQPVSFTQKHDGLPQITDLSLRSWPSSRALVVKGTSKLDLLREGSPRANPSTTVTLGPALATSLCCDRQAVSCADNRPHRCRARSGRQQGERHCRLSSRRRLLGSVRWLRRSTLPINRSLLKKLGVRIMSTQTYKEQKPIIRLRNLLDCT